MNIYVDRKRSLWLLGGFKITERYQYSKNLENKQNAMVMGIKTSTSQPLPIYRISILFISIQIRTHALKVGSSYFQNEKDPSQI